MRNKRTLKKRIRKLIATINFYSLLTMLTALMLLFGASASYLGEIASTSIAYQMSRDLNTIWSKAVSELKVDSNFSQTEVSTDNSNSNYNKIFSLLGKRYVLSPNIDNRLQNIDDENLKTLINEHAELKDNMSNICLVDYKIYKGQTLVYSSEDSNDFANLGDIKSGKLMNMLSKEVTQSAKIENSNSTLTIKVRINPTLILIGYVTLIVAGILIFLITLMLARLFAKPFSSMVIKPLNDLESKMHNLAEGNIEAAMGNAIMLKKPVREVETLADSTNKIMSKMSEYVGLLENQKDELEAQNNALEENSSALTSMNAALANKHSKLKNILDHVEQGLLTFNKSLLVNHEYSQECERIFSADISQNKLSKLLYEGDKNSQSFIDDLLIKIFESEESKRPLYIALLPEELLINEKNINLSYKIVKDERNEDIIMVILSDITEKRKLEKKMDDERNILKMVVKAIINRNEFLQLSKEYKDFCLEDFSMLKEDEFDEVLRKVHTFKGNFSQFDMLYVVKELDKLENDLYDDKSANTVNCISGNQLYSWLCEDLEVIESYTGNNFLKDEEMFYIKKSKLTEIEEKLKRVLSAYECKTVLPLIKSLGYRSVKELLVTYPAYIDKLSQRLNKSIKPLEVKGDEVMVDTNYYSDVSKTLVHIFRNCVDHGIESEDERLERGKEQIGNITCEIKDLGDNFSITISDDGRGIDVPLLEKKCISLNLLTEEQLQQMTYEQKLNLIFEHGISTKDTATTISGRGVGMAAVKESVEISGGTIDIQSKKDKYTSFIITLPKVEEVVESNITPHRFMEEMLKTTKSIVAEQSQIELISRDIEEANIISLNKVTSLISLKGSINSIVMISANEAMAKRLVEGFIIEEITEDEKDIYAEDVLGEICNNILGNTFGLFEEDSDVFQISIPAMISNKGAYLKYTNSDILTCTLEHEDLKLSINILLQHDDLEKNLGEALTWQEY